MIGNKVTDRISKNAQQSDSETVTNEHDKEISKEMYIYIFPEERPKIKDNLILI